MYNVYEELKVVFRNCFWGQYIAKFHLKYQGNGVAIFAWLKRQRYSSFTDDKDLKRSNRFILRKPPFLEAFFDFYIYIYKHNINWCL